MKKQSIKLIAMLMLVAMAVSLFAGCGGQKVSESGKDSTAKAVEQAGQDGKKEETKPAQERVLRVGAQAWMLEKFQLKEAAEQFMKDHPGVKVEINKVELADTTSYILQWSQGKTNVDIALGGSREQAVQYVAKDLIEDFETGFFDDKLKKEDFIPAVFELGNIEGTQYMIPLMGEVYYLVVRKDMMAAAGLVDKDGQVIPPKTWEELYEYAKKLTKKENGKFVQTGLGIDWGNDFMHYTYMACLQAAKGSIYDGNTNRIDFKSDKAKYLLENWAKMVRDGIVPTDTFADTNAARTNFKAGNVAMHLTVHSRWPEYATTLGYDKVTLVPIPGAAENGSLAFIHGMVIPKASAEKELAKQFIKERLMDKGFQLWTLDNFGKMPVLKRNFEGAKAPEWADIAQAANKATNAPLYKDWAKIQKKIQVELQNAILSKQTVDVTLKNLNAEINAIDTSTGLK